MHNLLRTIFFLAVYLIGSVQAAERATSEDAVKMVQKVIAFMKENGKEKTLAEVNNPQSKRFIDRDLYIVINSTDGKNLAHGVNPKIVGRDLSTLKDGEGKSFVKESLAAVAAKGKIWIDYKWPNPVTGQMERKSTYYERYEDVIIACGIYK